MEGAASPASHWGRHMLLNLFKTVLGGGNGRVVKSVPLFFCVDLFLLFWVCLFFLLLLLFLTVNTSEFNTFMSRIDLSMTKNCKHLPQRYTGTKVGHTGPAITDLISEDFSLQMSAFGFPSPQILHPDKTVLVD